MNRFTAQPLIAAAKTKARQGQDLTRADRYWLKRDVARWRAESAARWAAVSPRLEQWVDRRRDHHGEHDNDA